MGFFVLFTSPPPPLALDACLSAGRGEGRGEGEEISTGYGHDQVIPCIK